MIFKQTLCSQASKTNVKEICDVTNSHYVFAVGTPSEILPWRNLAPESFNCEFSTKSDIWMYGEYWCSFGATSVFGICRTDSNLLRSRTFFETIMHVINCMTPCELLCLKMGSSYVVSRRGYAENIILLGHDLVLCAFNTVV